MSPRPVTLAEIAERSESLEDFGRHFRDWLHEIRRHSSRSQLEAVVQEEPPRLTGRFKQGEVADAWLAAYAEHLAGRIDRPVPAWAHKHQRVSPEPWFAADDTSPRLRLIALRDSPAAFKKRNLFTPTVELPLDLRAGRPVKSAEHKRRNNAERQRRFRARRLAELKQLRVG